MTKTGFVLLAGEITTKASLDYPKIVRDAVREIGFTQLGRWASMPTRCAVMVAVEQQSPDIAQGVDRGDPAKQGAGDQGLMFGYACDETKELMPMPIQMAHQLAAKLAEVRKKQTKGIDWLRPDGKTQVSVRYEDGKVTGIEAIVVSTQHDEKVKQKTIEEAIRELVIKPIVPAKLITNKTKIHINPTGRFVIGGPHGDAGLTGRKIIVDTYGGYARHGGGAFSGKDPSQGRSLGRVLRALHREARRRGGPREALRGPVRVRDRRRRAGLDARRHVRHRHRLRREAHEGRARDVRRAPGHADQGARPAPPDLQARRPRTVTSAARRPEFTWEKTPLVEKLRDHAKSGNGHAATNGNGKTASSKKVAPKTKASAVARA